jgi:hypothetical protein
LFYTTLIFASLVHGGHLWLVSGALGAALAYSGTAVVHAILLIWRGPAAGALDIDALMVILSTACLISVPLLKWSSTLRKLGDTARKSKEEPFECTRGHHDSKSVDYEEDSRDASEFGTRTVVIYWALLVIVAFAGIFYAGELGLFGNRTYFPVCPDVSKVRCSFGANTSIGLVTPDFVTANDCTNPCNYVAKFELFRPLSDLVLLNRQQSNRFYEMGSE